VRREKALDFMWCNPSPESQHGYRFTKGKAALALNPKPAFGFRSAANPELLPKAKPWTVREHFVVPSIGSREISGAQWSDVRCFEHFL
jgi:hypothetical protein